MMDFQKYNIKQYRNWENRYWCALYISASTFFMNLAFNPEQISCDECYIYGLYTKKFALSKAL